MCITVWGMCITDASAGNITAAMNVEQARGKAPNVTAYVNGKKVTKESTYTAEIEGDDFKENVNLVWQSTQTFKESKEGIRYIILLDNSRSVAEWQFYQAKKELVTLRKNISDKDQMNLYTVGSDRASGNKKQIVKSVGKQNLKQDIKAIQSISREKAKTVLYRSLNQVLETADNIKQRTIILLLTDGEDDSQGKNNQTYQVNEVLKQSKIPIYGLLLENVSQHPNWQKIENTKRNIFDEKISRGYYEECNSSKAVAKGFQKIRQILYNETYVVTYQEENNSNKTTTNAKLCMTSNGNEVKLGNGRFSYNRREKDTKGPVIQKIKKTSANAIQLEIKDDKTKSILGADKKENYIVKDKDKKDWKIDKVNVKKGKYELIFAQKLYSGDYTITCNGITDDSQEQNPVQKSAKFSFKGRSAGLEGAKEFAKSYWWILLLLIVLLLGGGIFVVVRRKAGEVTGLDIDSLEKSASKRIRLLITDGQGNVSEEEIRVEGSIFVGRSDICNIYFEDDLLSRQHFAIEITKMGCYVVDLQTTNATYVNGVKLTEKRKLTSGDVITAGREKFVFCIVDDKATEENNMEIMDGPL